MHKLKSFRSLKHQNSTKSFEPTFARQILTKELYCVIKLYKNKQNIKSETAEGWKFWIDLGSTGSVVHKVPTYVH